MVAVAGRKRGNRHWAVPWRKGVAANCTLGRFADDSIGELLLDSSKSNSTADTNARDSAIVFSFAVQHGANPEAIRRALSRDSQGRATGPLAAALDLLA